jgi:DNA-binding transcriptional LysR family regulator
MIEFAVPHTLAFTFFPAWLMDLRKRFGEMKSRLIALNVHDAVMRLTEGSCDLLVAYHHASQPLQLSPDRYEMLSLGQETLAPYAKGGSRRQAAVSPGHHRATPASRSWAMRRAPTWRASSTRS